MEENTLIQDYLNGNLSEEAKNQFRQRLIDNPSFRKEFELEKQMHIFLSDTNAKEEYTSTINQLGDTYFPNESEEKPITKRTPILLLIALILLIGVAAYFFLQSNNEDIYEAHSQHFALHLVLKNSENEIALDAETAFNNGHYDQARLALEKYLIINEIDTKAKLALGICFLELGDNEKALEYFERLSSGDSTLKSQAQWYKALYFIKLKQFDKAKEALSDIPEYDTQLINKKKLLLEDLNKN